MLVIVKPGHFRDSLVALLKTIPVLDITLLDNVLQDWTSDPPALDIAILDGDGLNQPAIDFLKDIRDRYPGIKFLILVDNIWQPGWANTPLADCILPKSVPAGEFLRTVELLRTVAPEAKLRVLSPAAVLT